MLSNKNKDFLGVFFFALSIIFLFYLFITPLNHLVCQIDEFFTRTVLLLPVNDIITVTSTDVHPPLYYLMGKLVAELSAIFGIDLLYSLKLLSILAYILILIISATKIRKEYGWLAAGLFAFALAIMDEFSRYYLISRMYSWAVLFILLAFLSFRSIIYDKSNKKSWILLTLFSLLGAYTHYFAAISAFCIYLILLTYIIKFKKDELKNWLISAVVGVVLYLPWVPSLISQLVHVHKGYWITEITLEKAILFFGNYAYNGDVLVAIVAIVFLAAFIIIYVKESKNIDKKDQFLILSGIGVYLGTIILGISISLLFRPIMDDRYLMPASGILWLVISIILSKLENKKMFLISLVLIFILLISGVANTINTYDDNYHNGIAQKEILDNITQDNNSMLIVSRANDTLYYLSYDNQVDFYCLNETQIFGVTMDRLHQNFDFKNVDETKIDELIANNSDKNIYVLCWQEPNIHSPYEVLHKEIFMYYVKINTTDLNSTNKTS